MTIHQLKSADKIKTPIAVVVVSKVESNSFMDKVQENGKATDEAVRIILGSYGMGNLVKHVELKYQEGRFFTDGTEAIKWLLKGKAAKQYGGEDLGRNGYFTRNSDFPWKRECRIIKVWK